jgi:hypothetical protein
MKAFIAITFTDNEYDFLDLCVNNILMSPVTKEVHVFDATTSGVENDVKAFFRSYNKFKVFLHRVKAAKNLKGYNACKNRALLESIHLYKAKRGFHSYVHINPNLFFKGHSLQILIDQSQLYSCVSPVIVANNEIQVVDGIADRWGFNIFNKALDSISFITGQVEESFAINHKCFGLSNRYIRRIDKLWQSDQEPNDYINQVLYEYGHLLPKVDTNTFVYENLY